MEIPHCIAMLGYRVDCCEHHFMHLFGLSFFGLLAIFWVVHGLRIALGAMQIPWLRDYSAAIDAECQRRGWQLVRIEEDIAGGGKLDRPGLNAALDAA